MSSKYLPNTKYTKNVGNLKKCTVTLPIYGHTVFYMQKMCFACKPQTTVTT